MQGRDTWKALIARHGINCDLIRVQTGSADVSVTVKMMRQFATEDPLVHEVSQQTAKFVVEHVKLEDAAFPLPPRKSDRVESLGKIYTISLVEPKASHGELVGYKLTCAGGT